MLPIESRDKDLILPVQASQSLFLFLAQLGSFGSFWARNCKFFRLFSSFSPA